MLHSPEYPEKTRQGKEENRPEHDAECFCERKIVKVIREPAPSAKDRAAVMYAPVFRILISLTCFIPFPRKIVLLSSPSIFL